MTSTLASLAALPSAPALQETLAATDRTGMVALRKHVLALAAAAVTIVLALMISEPQPVTSAIVG